MTVAIMQPYFFPYLGYFSLIKNTNLFVLLDEVQFIRHGWIERNRILKPDVGWQYVSCPLVKHSRETPIKHIKIRNETNWKKKILAQLVHYKKRAPFYSETVSLLNRVFQYDTDSISVFNERALIEVCHYLGFNFNIKNFKDLNIDIERPTMPDEWALNICKAMEGVERYINPIGGLSFFDKRKYEENHIKISFQNFNLSVYSQKGNAFEPGLSIIDVLMFNNVSEINKMLDSYELL
jgi:hypothetical protein